MNLGFQEFWLGWRAVYRADGESVFPTKRHLSEQSARAEAERLARKHPGNEFYVLRSVAAGQVENGAEMIADLLGLVDRLLAERNGLVERVTTLEAEMERRTGDS